MKPFAKRILALASAAAITLTTLPAVCGTEPETTPGKILESWTSIDAESVEEIVPAQSRARTASASAPLTRESLSSMAMNAYKSVTGLTDEDLGETAPLFLDTAETDVLNAYRMGFVIANTNGIFAPEDAVTRQDFFATAVRLLDAIGYPYSADIIEDLSDFADADELVAYAVQPAQVLLYIGAIDKKADLEPTRAITAEEAVVILDRVMAFYAEWELDPVEPGRYLGEEVAEFALNYVGCRYVRGGQGPKKFDCSGFVYYVYNSLGYKMPRMIVDMNKQGTYVSKANLQPGDVVIFQNTYASGLSHVGIYVGDGKFIHSPNSRSVVSYADLNSSYYTSHYYSARRICGN